MNCVRYDHASVSEQSDLRAGDGGFQVNVRGQTELVGGAITSSERAVQQGVNDFESARGVVLRDIENRASYEAKGSSMSAGVGDSKPTGSAGLGADKGSASSTTAAAISGIAGQKAARTGDQETGLAPIFDKERVKEEIGAQVAVTAAFSQQAPKAWADHAEAKQREALKRGDAAEAAKWAEGGEYRAAGHAVLGLLSGGAAGAAGALSSATLMPQAGKLIDDTSLPSEVKQALGMVTSATLGAIVGGQAGAGMAFGVDTNNRQLHPGERKLAQELAKKSGGKYTAEQIEEQMRLMGNRALTKAEPNTTTVLTDMDSIQKNLDNDPSMPKQVSGPAVVEIPGNYDGNIQSFIVDNTREDAGYIPGVSRYVGSRAPVLARVDKPSDINSAARCANGDLACASSVGDQQNPSLTASQRTAAGAYFGRASADYQRMAALATSTGQPQMVLSFEIAAGVAGILEQAFLPNAGKVGVDAVVDMAA